ncbi:MAG: HigA family addiction module antidote protein [Azoarcus sp.]|jgi:addiction module HigA family antidote|nr:HigA family addiction module antidote protein [Azoarcus sp.]
MSKMFDPPHPGSLLPDVLEELGLSVTEAARQLGVSRVMFSRLVNCRAGISAEMALRLEAWLKAPDGGGPTAEVWLKMQSSYDLWQAEHSGKPAFVVRPAMAGA